MRLGVLPRRGIALAFSRAVDCLVEACRTPTALGQVPKQTKRVDQVPLGR